MSDRIIVARRCTNCGDLVPLITVSHVTLSRYLYDRDRYTELTELDLCRSCMDAVEAGLLPRSGVHRKP